MTKSLPEDKLFCVCQKAFINKGGEVLVLFDLQSELDFPGGKVQEGETNFDQSLKREVKEETGLEIEVGDIFHRWYYEYLPGDYNYGKVSFMVVFECEYAGGEVKISNEHSRYEWVSKSNYRKLNNDSEEFRALEKYFENQ